jgi:hypothetical protein
MLILVAVRKEMALDDYRKKTDYGKTPEYLAERKTELEKQHQDKKVAEQLAAANVAPTGFVVLPETERLAILSGLQSNLNKLNSDYGKMSLVIDTVPKINRCVSIAHQMACLFYLANWPWSAKSSTLKATLRNSVIQTLSCDWTERVALESK